MTKKLIVAEDIVQFSYISLYLYVKYGRHDLVIKVGILIDIAPI